MLALELLVLKVSLFATATHRRARTAQPPQGRAGYHCTLRNSGILGNNYLCIASEKLTSTAFASGHSKHAGSLCWGFTTSVPSGTGYTVGALSISVNGEVHDFEAGDHWLQLPKTDSAVELLASAGAGTSTLLALKRDAGMVIMFK